MKENKRNYLLEAVVGIFKNLPRGKVLDLGCGDGDYAKILQGLGFQVVASDMDSQRFRYADTIEFKASNLDKPLPFEENYFDYVLFLEVIEHLYNPDAVIKQLNLVLKPDASLFISTPNILNLGSRMRFLFEGNFDFFREPTLDYSKLLDCGIQNMHVIPWRYQELEYLLFKNGFFVDRVYADLLRNSLKPLGFILLPLMKFQSWQKEKRSEKSGGVGYARINKVLFTKELLFGRHLIIQAKK